MSTMTHSDDMQKPQIFGFWLYLMTDVMLFASLFATFMVLRHQTAGSATSEEIISLPFVFIETVILLFSSFLAGAALLLARAGRKAATVTLLILTGVLGLTFLGMELYEFAALIGEGHSWTASAFLTSYFALVGTHGLHIAIGLIWLIASIVFILRRGFTERLMNRLTMWSMFWHFLDIIWIGIFTIVYLVGVL